MYSKVSLAKYFDIKSVIQSDKINFKVSNKEDKESVPFLGRSASNNGIVDYVKYRNGFINKGGSITIALDGSTGSTFYQHHSYCSGQNIWILEPKKEFIKEINPAICLFLITTIRKAVIHYSWNLSLTKTRLLNINILLPLKGELLDTAFIKKEMSRLRNIDFIKSIPEERI